VPSGDRLFLTWPAQLVAGIDRHPVPAKASNTQVIISESLKRGIIALPSEFCFAVRNGLFCDVEVTALIAGTREKPERVDELVDDEGEDEPAHAADDGRCLGDHDRTLRLRH
jgi:hypothetical protein